MDDPAREGAKQLKRFDPARAARLDDPARFAYLAPAAVLASLDLPTGATLLDFGTGTGTYAIALARLRPDLHIIALDEQPEMLDALRDKLAASGLTNVEPRGAADGRGLRGRADRILALNVLHELGDIALSDLGSLLRARGKALFIDWNADVERPVGPPADHVYGVEAARARLAAHGYAVGAVQLFAYHFGLIATRPAGLTETP